MHTPNEGKYRWYQLAVDEKRTSFTLAFNHHIIQPFYFGENQEKMNYNI